MAVPELVSLAPINTKLILTLRSSFQSAFVAVPAMAYLTYKNLIGKLNSITFIVVVLCDFSHVYFIYGKFPRNGKY